MLMPKEEVQKASTVAGTQQKIKNWFNRQRTSVGLAGNLWIPFLKQLRQPTGPAPKRTSDNQFYMADHADTAKKDHLNVQCQITLTLFKDESEEVKHWIWAEATAEHVALMEAHNSAVKGLPSINKEEQEIAWEWFSAVVVPLLASISEYTGYKLTLLAGRVSTNPEVDIQVVVLNTGKIAGSEGKTFAKWDKKIYHSTLQGFRGLCGRPVSVISFLDESKHQATDPTAPITPDAAPNADTAAPNADTAAPDTAAATPNADATAPDTDTVAPNADAAAPDTATTAPTALAAAPNTTTAPAAAVAGLASDDDGMDMDHQPRDDEGGERMPSADIFAGLNQFERMSMWVLEQENNVVLNNETFVWLGLNKTFEEAIGLPSKKGKKCKQGKRTQGGSQSGSERGLRRAGMTMKRMRMKNLKRMGIYHWGQTPWAWVHGRGLTLAMTFATALLSYMSGTKSGLSKPGMCHLCLSINRHWQPPISVAMPFIYTLLTVPEYSFYIFHG
ncbi:hypothetical protein B0H14DRAFT_3604399 [Mycena olivaceomarginata]|nr:hypothetical protein B0H14DRAFT_3604399 [Mycena olivaceomarginata]